MNAAPRRRILYIPGKNPKPPVGEHYTALRRSLIRGVSRTDPAAAREIEDDAEVFRLIAWNHTYYGRYEPLGPDLPWVDEVLRRDGPTEQDMREAMSWRRKFAWLMYSVADVFPSLIDLMPDPAVRNTVAETERYFADEDGVGGRVREVLKAPLRQMLAAGERVLLIGHSMGSVVAYDALWELTHYERIAGKIDLFLTIGSPLGMRFVQARLLGRAQAEPARYPGCIRRWFNVAAQGDLTSIDMTLSDDFAAMRRLGLVESIVDRNGGVFNYFRNDHGLNVHRSYGYLVNPRVGEGIARWWRET
jgi:hypothetical protein